jgi:DNA helicase-2/ATP-dependent DNA helicase PcrA
MPGSIHEKIEKIKSMASKEKDPNAEHVLITSIHKSKGLEWDTVIIPSLEEKSFPYFYNNQPPDMEAERRLFFVGITRCIKHVHLLTSVPREKFIGKREDYKPKSRFISELKLNDLGLELGHISKIDDRITSKSRLEIIRKTAMSLSATA